MSSEQLLCLVFYGSHCAHDATQRQMFKYPVCPVVSTLTQLPLLYTLSIVFTHLDSLAKHAPAKMVLYKNDEIGDPFERGLFSSHEARVEKAADDDARKFKYENQRRFVTNKKLIEEVEADDRVYIVIDEQRFRTLYWKDIDHLRGEEIIFKADLQRIPEKEEGIPKARLMRYSSYARTRFTEPPKRAMINRDRPGRDKSANDKRVKEQSKIYEPKEDELLFPLRYPQIHRSEYGYVYPDDYQMAYITQEPFVETIIPWFKDASNFKEGQRPKPLDIPDSMVSKIQLYNAMLQLGMPWPLQKPLIEVLCKEIYCRKLSQCALETLELTIGRFHSRSVAVLDPVLSCLVGTYGMRAALDRNNTRERNDDDDDDTDLPGNSKRRKREYFSYDTEDADRKRFQDDTVTVPPELPVIGHCIRHWSGVRENGDVRATHLGYPLHIGKMTYYERHDTKRAKPAERTDPKDTNGGESPTGPDELTPADKPEVFVEPTVRDELDSKSKLKATSVPRGRGKGKDRGKKTTANNEKIASKDKANDKPNAPDVIDIPEEPFERWPHSHNIGKLERFNSYDVLLPMKHLRNRAGHPEDCDCEDCND